MPLPRRLNHATGPLTLDAALGDVAVMLSGDVSALAVTNLTAARSFRAVFIQDAAGGHAVTWPDWDFAAGPPAIGADPGAVSAVLIAGLAAGPRAWATDFGSLEMAAAVLIADDPAAADAGTIALVDTRLAKAADLSDLASAESARTNLGVYSTAAADAAIAAATAPAALKASNLSDLADAAAARRNLGVPGLNLIENPSFDVWQAGTSFALIANTVTFVADRWKTYRAGAGGATVSRQPGFNGALYCARLQRDAGNSSVATIPIYHQIESSVAAQLAGRSVVLSADVRAGANFSAAGAVARATIISGTGVDETMNLGGASFPTGNSATNIGDLAAGSAARLVWPSFNVPAGVTELAARLQFTPTGTAGAADYLEITNVKLELGSATPFVSTPPADTMVRCLRHYEKSFASGTAPTQNAGSGTGEQLHPAPLGGASGERLASVPFKVRKRAAPTVTLYNTSATNAQVRDLTAGADCSSSASANVTDRGFRVTCTGNASTAAGNDLAYHWTADARL